MFPVADPGMGGPGAPHWPKVRTGHDYEKQSTLNTGTIMSFTALTAVPSVVWKWTECFQLYAPANLLPWASAKAPVIGLRPALGLVKYWTLNTWVYYTLAAG